MFKLPILATALAVSLCSFFSVGCAETKTAADGPEEALAVAIRLLETKDRTAFVKRFLAPDVLEKLKQRYDIDDINLIAQALLGDRTERMEQLLREINLVKDAKPVFNNERTQATFSAKGAAGKSFVVKFTLIDGKWYLYSRLPGLW